MVFANISYNYSNLAMLKRQIQNNDELDEVKPQYCLPVVFNQTVQISLSLFRFLQCRDNQSELVSAIKSVCQLGHVPL